MFKVGLIGCGYMGTMHKNCYAALGDKVEIAAVADVRREKAEELAAGTNAVIYDSAEALINNADVDYVDICLPTYLHAQYAIAAMKKGMHVFVEKPLCMNEEECAAILKTQEETGKLAQVGQVIRFWDEYVWLKNVKESGVYGKIISANFKRLSPIPGWAWENWLHDKEKSGGMALDLHVHDIDYIRYLMGEPKEVKASGINDANGLTEYMMTTYVYDDAVATAEGSWSFPGDFRFTMAYCVRFEKATVCHDSGTGEFIIYPVTGGTEKPVIEKSFEGSVSGGNVSSLGGYFNELSYFLDRLADPSLPDIASLKEGARSVELALLGYSKI